MSVQFYQQYPKVSSTKVKGQKISFFCKKDTIFIINMTGFEEVVSVHVPGYELPRYVWHKWDTNQLTFSVLFVDGIKDKNPIT